jgi:hypothetical protein
MPRYIGRRDHVQLESEVKPAMQRNYRAIFQRAGTFFPNEIGVDGLKPSSLGMPGPGFLDKASLSLVSGILIGATLWAIGPLSVPPNLGFNLNCRDANRLVTLL